MRGRHMLRHLFPTVWTPSLPRAFARHVEILTQPRFTACPSLLSAAHLFHEAGLFSDFRAVWWPEEKRRRNKKRTKGSRLVFNQGEISIPHLIRGEKFSRGEKKNETTAIFTISLARLRLSSFEEALFPYLPNWPILRALCWVPKRTECLVHLHTVNRCFLQTAQNWEIILKLNPFTEALKTLANKNSPKDELPVVYMSRLCYKNMFMKGHSSFVSCILSFSLTTISETSIMGFYYLSICVVIKLGFINRQAVYISNLLYCLGSVLLQKLKIKSERERLSSRGHCLIFIHLAEIIFSLCLSF